jgi:tellurium resistance protein TerZ
MAITLTKNQTISLEKTAGSGLTKISLGLGWDPVKSGFLGKLMGKSDDIDLDASCLLFDASLQPVDVVWFKQLQSKDGSIRHTGDNRTGVGGGDDESISVDLATLPQSVSHLVFTVNSFTGANFERVQNAYCRILDAGTKTELARFNLSEQGAHTGVVMASLTRAVAGWDFKALGQPTRGRTADDLVTFAAQAIRA